MPYEKRCKTCPIKWRCRGNLTIRTKRCCIPRMIAFDPAAADDECGQHRIYIAYRIDVECGYPVAFVTVNDNDRVEMVEVNDCHRRKGIGKEVLRAIMRHRRGLYGKPVSTAGAALCKAARLPEREA